ncbi:phosphopantetheine-binding protein [Prauserella oleivorans]|uniref:Phosphopantetheine-binding protein n=1 Tax=Prauserella oleivorans TaxID=1478153 RepID=A0ABW5WF38_9PSEU
MSNTNDLTAVNGTTALSAERIRADVAELLGRDPAEIGMEENLLDLGLDSIRIMSLIERWRAAGANEVEFPDLAERPELAHWITLVTGEAQA